MTRPGTHGDDPRPEPLDAAERELAEHLARLGPHGEPPVEVDTRILAAAHAATNATPRRAGRLPLALGVAASLVLALGLAWQLRPLLEPPPPVEDDGMDMAAASTDGSQASDPAAGPAEEHAAAGDDPAEARRAARMGGPDRAQAVPSDPPAPPLSSAQETVKPQAFPAPAAALPPRPAPPPPAPPPPAPPPPAPAARNTAPAAPAPVAESGAADAADARMRRRSAESRRRADDGATGEAQAIQESAAAAAAPTAGNDAYLRQAQLERIRGLRDAGRTAQARDELDAFLARWPGYPLPDDLQRLRR